jgi:nicotinamide-nucleotide amidase
VTAGQLDRLIGEFAARGLTVATAESLTGGLVAAAITAVPGASAVFRGGAVVYATDSKASVLGVPAELLAQRGPVDPDVAVALAGGGCRLFGADVGVATTGVAGPAPQGGHDAGTVFVAAVWPARADVRVSQLTLSGDRHAIRSQSVAAAIDLLAAVVG